MVPESQDDENDFDLPIPVDAQARQRRSALAALVQSPQVFNAVKSCAEETIARWFVALPTRTQDEKLQYADYKMVTDAIESMMQLIVQEGEQGFQDSYSSGEERNYPTYQSFEANEQWTNLKTN